MHARWRPATPVAAIAALLAGTLVLSVAGGGPAEAASDKPPPTLVSTFGAGGSAYPGSLQFSGAKGVDVTASGNLLVAGTSRVHLVAPDGASLAEWGTQGSGPGQFTGANDVAEGPDGSIYVADTSNHRIQRLGPDGSFVSSWGGSGSGSGQFRYPMSVAVDAGGKVYVADQINDRVQVFDAAGGFIESWGPGTISDGIYEPNGVAVAPDGSVLVAVRASGRDVVRLGPGGVLLDQWGETRGGQDVQAVAIDVAADGTVVVASGDQASDSYTEVVVLDSDLELVAEFGGPGESDPAPGQLTRPDGIAVDADGTVWVGDGPRLHHFTVAGGFIERFGTLRATTFPRFDEVADAEVAPNGDVYVVERANHRVQRLAPDGSFVGVWGGPDPGAGPSQFASPESIAIDGAGDVYVADTGNDRIQRFSADGTFEAEWGSSGPGPGQLDRPGGVTVDADGDVFVADSGNDRIQRFSSSGGFEAAWTGARWGVGPLDDPRDVAIGAGGAVYVVDWGHERLVRSNRNGGGPLVFAEEEVPNAYSDDAGLAVDDDGRVYLGTEDVVHDGPTIYEFSPSGVLTASWPPAIGTLIHYPAIAAGPTGKLYLFRRSSGDQSAAIFQQPTGPAVAIEARTVQATGTVGRPLDVHVVVANPGTATLTGVTVNDAMVPGCSGAVEDLAPGEDRTVACTHTPIAPGPFTNSATVDTDQTAPLVSESASVEIAPYAPPVLVGEWGTVGTGAGQLDNPPAFVVDPTGDVIVATGNSTIARFDQDGDFESVIVNASPDDLDVDPAGNLLALTGPPVSSRTRKYSPVGTLLWERFVTRARGIGADGAGRVWHATVPDYETQTGASLVRLTPTGDIDRSFAVGDAEFVTTGDVLVDDARSRLYRLRGGSLPIKTYSATTGEVLGTATVAALAGDIDAGGNLYLAVPGATGRPLIEVYDPSGALLVRWQVPGATDVSVAPDGTVYVLDAEAGRIRRYGFGVTGAVTDQVSSDPVPGAWVLAVDTSTGRLTGSTAASDGRFTVTAGMGDRWLGFLDPSGDHTGEWFDDHPLSDLAGADGFAVDPGAPNVASAALAPAGRTARMAGVVTGSPGDASAPGVFVGVVDLSDGSLAGGATTGVDGGYVVDGLGSGAHLVVFLDPAGAHALEFFDDSPSPGGSQVVGLAAGQTSIADAVLASAIPAGSGATLQGTVTGGGDPIDGALVVALDAADFSFVRGGFSDVAGHYELEVPPGSYRIEFVDPSAAHAGEWHDDHPITDLAGSTPVAVAAGPPLTVDADLEPAGYTGSIAGSVTGPGNEAAQGGWVVVLDTATFGFVAGATVDADGGYVVGGLGAGDYVVGFIDPTSTLATEWHDNAPDIGSGTPVAVAAGETTAVDAALAPA